MTSPTQEVTSFFVYGTLKRGGSREKFWPKKPLSIVSGWTRGGLYALAEFPAMRPGDDKVLGELWELAPGDMPETLRVLDAVEEATGRPDALYERWAVRCFTLDGRERTAFAYLLLDESQLADGRRVLPRDDGYCSWPE
jgi:gamma-glutamylcyclotransferase (GGCT)/AIG2-like uncharacterized protein YtfP